MKEFFTQLLSHLSKNALAAALVTTFGIIAYGWWSDDQKFKQEIKSSQTNLEKSISSGFKKSEERDRAMRLDFIQMQGTMEIVVGTLPELKQTQIRQYEQLSKQIREEQKKNTSKSEDESYIIPKSKEIGLINNTIPDDVKKKEMTDQALN